MILVKIKHLLFVMGVLCIVGWGPFLAFTDRGTTEGIGTRAWLNHEVSTMYAKTNHLDRKVLELSLTAYAKARHQGLDRKQLLTIIDYSKPSTEKRLWVLDLKNERVLFNTWVAHGKNSGKVIATSFSNESSSLKSSIGVLLTKEPYMGGNGYSLRMEGLERGINDNAYRRSIVIHGAWYANEDVAKKYGYLGRSWGCPAVSPELAKPLIDTIKDNTIIVAYYPDRRWLQNSTYLAG